MVLHLRGRKVIFRFSAHVTLKYPSHCVATVWIAVFLVVKFPIRSSVYSLISEIIFSSKEEYLPRGLLLEGLFSAYTASSKRTTYSVFLYLAFYWMLFLLFILTEQWIQLSCMFQYYNHWQLCCIIRWHAMLKLIICMTSSYMSSE